MKTRLILFLLCFAINRLPGAPLPVPTNLRVIFTETSLDISWDSLPGAVGYNLYDRPPSNKKGLKKRKINPALITSGPHFSYIWDFENEMRVRKIKGYEHHLSLTAVMNINGKEKEGPASEEFDNNYFEGYRNVLTRADILRILVPAQAAPLLPVVHRANTREDFIRFMETTGRKLHQELARNINPLEVGACAPVSTLLVKLLDRAGLSALRVEGTFIKEYHTFIIINVDGVEYILDFTADQFVPGVTPVCFPRDLSNLNRKGRLSVVGTPIYQPGKIYTADQTDLSQNKTSEFYRNLLQKLQTEK